MLRLFNQSALTLKRNLSNILTLTLTRFQSPQLALAPALTNPAFENNLPSSNSSNGSPSLSDCLWLAVPKSKITRGKKRMKTTNQKRIKTKNHVIVDSRTGEMTLRHRLPHNWKDYLEE
jgi:ribosomal protein L32